MAVIVSNDNYPASVSARSGETTLDGRAALLLVESLIHGLIARSVIGLKDAVEIVDIATQVEEEISTDRQNAFAQQNSVSKLTAISTSLRYDLSI